MESNILESEIISDVDWLNLYNYIKSINDIKVSNNLNFYITKYLIANNIKYHTHDENQILKYNFGNYSCFIYIPSPSCWRLENWKIYKNNEYLKSPEITYNFYNYIRYLVENNYNV